MELFWSSVTKSCPTLRDTIECSKAGFLVFHHLLEFAQTHVFWISDAIQPSHSLSPPSCPAIYGVQFTRSVMSESLQPHEPQHTRPPCPSPTPRVHPNSCALSQGCPPIISSCVIPVSFYPQSFPSWGSFQMSQLFSSGGESIGVSASTTVPPMNTQDWSPLGWTGWISLKSKGLSRVFSNTTVQKHQFSSSQPSSQSNSHTHTWLMEKP